MSKNIQYKKLTDICEIINGEWGTEINENSKNIASVIRTTNFLNNGKIDIQNKELVKREMNKNKIEQKQLKKGDIIIEKSGGSPNQPVGRVVFFNLNSNEIFLCNNFTSILRVKENINSKYIFYFLRNSYKNNKVLKFQNKTTGIINLKLQNYLNRSYVYLPELKIQNKVVNILDILESILEKNQNYLIYLKELTKSLFTRMFGDIRTNSFNWKQVKLQDLCSSLVSGPFGSSLKKEFFVKNGYKVYEQKNAINQSADLGKYYIDEKKFKELQRFECKMGDIIMSCSGTVGKLFQLPENSKRGIINQALCKFSLNNKIKSTYFLKYLEKVIGNMELNGSGIKNISSVSYIKKVDINLPPIELQNKFAERIGKIEKLKFAIWKTISKVYKIPKKKGVENN